MPKITLENGKTIEISEESYKTLQEGVTTMPRRAEKRGRYWYVADDGEVLWDYEVGYEIDDYRYAIGNYYLSQKEAEHAAEVSKASGKVRLAILEANDGWEPDWGDKYQEKWEINYSYYQQRFIAFGTLTVDTGIKLPHIKSEEIAKDIIKNYKKELKLIWGV